MIVYKMLNYLMTFVLIVILPESSTLKRPNIENNGVVHTSISIESEAERFVHIL
jgi:hypothetical protein